MTLTEFLTGIKGRVAAATPGPWQIKPGEYVSFLGEQFFQVLNTHPDKDGDLTLVSANRTSLENAALIASSPTDLALAVEIIEVMREALIGIASETRTPYGALADETLAKIDELLKGSGK